MRTKTLVLSAVLCAAGALSSMAQNVYSLNVVGYYNVALTNGYQLFANQLDVDGTGTNNTLVTVFSTNLPNLSQVLTWNNAQATYLSVTYKTASSSFTGANIAACNAAVNPGNGVFVFLGPSAAPTTLTVVGQVMQKGAGVPVGYTPGYNIVSSQAPLSGGVQTTLGYIPNNLDHVLIWNNAQSQYISSTYKTSTGLWGGGEPQIAVGASFFLQTTATGSWTNTFVVQ